VAACAPKEGAFIALIEVHEAIPSMSDLARLVAAVMNEGRSEARIETATHVAPAANKKVALSDHH
jgi:hypothetical protein